MTEQGKGFKKVEKKGGEYVADKWIAEHDDEGVLTGRYRTSRMIFPERQPRALGGVGAYYRAAHHPVGQYHCYTPGFRRRDGAAPCPLWMAFRKKLRFPQGADGSST